ncbi:MAG: hypothetical protein D6798_14585 [Deltaproteobacteria bacterium]|nr:MAG: hypothetical protein D6798_14585 [Deltaproteobacteria bacterium]
MSSWNVSASGPRTSTALVGRPGDGWWLWAPVPLLALVAWLLRDVAPQVGTGGLLVLNFMHLAATWTRLYGEARRDHPWGATVLPVALIAFCAVVVGAGRTQLLLLLVFLANIPHIGLQNFGFIRAAERARGIDTTPLDRWLDKAYQAWVPTWLAFWFATRPGADLFDSRQLHLDRLPPALVYGVGVGVGVLAAIVWVRLAIGALRRRPVAPERFWLHLFWGPGALACFALLPPELAAIPLAGAHYIQYIVIVRRYHGRARARPGGAAGPDLWGRVPVVLYLVMLGLLAPGIPVLVHLLVSRWFSGVDLVVGSAASLHHFLVDGRIWKLRQPRVARVMFGA